MATKILSVNIGSASKKFALYAGEQELWQAHLEKEKGGLVATVGVPGRPETISLTPQDYAQDLSFTINQLLSRGVIKDPGEIKGVGLRVVAPGSFFQENRLLNKEYLAKLTAAQSRAPLHVAPVLAEIVQLEKALPAVAVVAVSDSAFHAALPEVFRRYSLPAEVAEKYDLYRFGYHGISMVSVIRKIKEAEGEIPGHVVICHLGSGVTITALKEGQSWDTSMGFTPLEGLVMGTRVGTIDAGAVTYLAQKTGMGSAELEEFFNKKCGLLGLSGKTADVRELLELEEGGDAGAQLALATFTAQVKKYIGAYTAQMGGLDLLVFTATVGERSFIMRGRICTGLERLGLLLDQVKNKATVSREGVISSANSPAKIAVFTSNEMGEIAREAAALLS